MAEICGLKRLSFVQCAAPEPEFEQALPRIVTRANVSFRFVRCSHQKSEYIAEVVALSWIWWQRLRHAGKNPATFVSTLAGYAARAVAGGRRLCRAEAANDALSRRAQCRHGFTTVPIQTSGNASLDSFRDAIKGNTRTPVFEQAAFRCDFPIWLATLSDRDRSLVGDLMQRERTGALARKYGLTAGRISQLRRQFHLDWTAFVGDSLTMRGMMTARPPR